MGQGVEGRLARGRVIGAAQLQQEWSQSLLNPKASKFSTEDAVQDASTETVITWRDTGECDLWFCFSKMLASLQWNHWPRVCVPWKKTETTYIGSGFYSWNRHALAGFPKEKVQYGPTSGRKCLDTKIDREWTLVHPKMHQSKKKSLTSYNYKNWNKEMLVLFEMKGKIFILELTP